ncbi:hypothetical protein K438DRAFT_1998241 [Mycena galopus ATCC 62051]|nr:hypothetical protein K438DRAFT_1998241 [Mycena galopus ATCC 62051]
MPRLPELTAIYYGLDLTAMLIRSVLRKSSGSGIPKDGQPCMDHDRSDGEALGLQEYSMVKMEVGEWGAAAKDAIEGKVGGRKVFLLAATLRPETMYSQMNCFVGTVFVMSDTKVFLCMYRAARNMVFPGIPKTRGDIDQLLEIDGAKLVGMRVKAPFA